MKARKLGANNAERVVQVMLQWSRADEGAEIAHGRKDAPSLQCFNGAAPMKARKFMSRKPVASAFRKLQWSRADEGAEIAFNGFLPYGVAQLQWSRADEGAEMALNKRVTGAARPASMEPRR